MTKNTAETLKDVDKENATIAGETTEPEKNNEKPKKGFFTKLFNMMFGEDEEKESQKPTPVSVEIIKGGSGKSILDRMSDAAKGNYEPDTSEKGFGGQIFESWLKVASDFSNHMQKNFDHVTGKDKDSIIKTPSVESHSDSKRTTPGDISGDDPKKTSPGESHDDGPKQDKTGTDYKGVSDVIKTLKEGGHFNTEIAATTTPISNQQPSDSKDTGR